LEDISAEELADQMLAAKNCLITLGRQVFRISSELSSLDESQRNRLQQLAQEHTLFDNPQIIYAQMEEFYKASAGYVELLKDLNLRMVELSGVPCQSSSKTV